MDFDAPQDFRAIFEAEFDPPPSAVQARIWREVFGDDYPEDLDTYSYVGLAELRRFAAELCLGPGSTLVDVGCGRGGPGAWVARETGATLIGLDIAERPLVDARKRAAAFGIDATFQRGVFEATGLPDATADAVMSVDALMFTSDKAAAFRELRRILRPGGRIALTTCDYDPELRPKQVADHRPLAEAAGLRVLAYDETAGWRERLGRTDELELAAAAEYAAESARGVEEVRAELEEQKARFETMLRRVFLVAVAV